MCKYQTNTSLYCKSPENVCKFVKERWDKSTLRHRRIFKAIKLLKINHLIWMKILRGTYFLTMNTMQFIASFAANLSRTGCGHCNKKLIWQIVIINVIQIKTKCCQKNQWQYLNWRASYIPEWCRLDFSEKSLYCLKG